MSRERYFLHLDFSSPVPVHAQLVEEIRRALARGHWKADDKMPSVRELAIKLGINPNTVAKSYDQLVGEGVVRVQRGVGVFAQELAASEREGRKLGERLDRLMSEALALGVARQALAQLCAESIRRVYGAKP